MLLNRMKTDVAYIDK